MQKLFLVLEAGDCVHLSLEQLKSLSVAWEGTCFPVLDRLKPSGKSFDCERCGHWLPS